MPFLNSIKLKLTKSKSATMVLAICFSIMVLFGSPLHDHDLDSSHVDLDCISCHLVHANVGLEQDEPDILVETQEYQSVSVSIIPQINFSISSFSSRAPPIVCWSVFYLIKNYLDLRRVGHFSNSQNVFIPFIDEIEIFLAWARVLHF